MRRRARPQELLFQLAQQAKAIGTALLTSHTARDTEAASFYFTRALRKLKIAGMADRDPHTLALRQLLADAEAQAEWLRAPPTMMQPGAAAGDKSRGPGGANGGPVAVADDDDSYCVVS